MATDVLIGSSDDELNELAEEAYLYFYPLVLMDVTRRVTTRMAAGKRPGFGPSNQFTHLRAFPPGDFQEVVRPNFDTLYSTLWFDIRDQPIVVSVPETLGRYYMLPLLDMWTDVFAVIGSRTTGSAAGSYAIVPSGWSGKLPDEVERITSPTPLGWILGRTQTNGESDYTAVHAVQDGFTATPLSEGMMETKSTQSAHEDDIDSSAPPVVHVEAMSGQDFFEYAADLLYIHPPHIVDQPIIARLARLGIRPGESFDYPKASAHVQAAIARAPLIAQARMTQAAPRANPIVNGWATPLLAMGVYGTAYLRRAIVARIGLGANLVEDAIYPVAYLDEEGEPPKGEHDYVLHFDNDELPPVSAFWSVTMYDEAGFTVGNRLARYALGDRDPLVFNEDGSLDLFLQHEDPGDARRPNWLPAPVGPLGVTLRLYSPRRSALDGSWSPPPLRRSRLRTKRIGK